ncbi:MAG: ABC transporter permease subunit [Kiritimatiellae bacterium]|nr:ABC transporter permease subunit [Kiritimatiellia bacterium]
MNSAEPPPMPPLPRGTPPNPARAWLCITLNELADAVRSRRAGVVLLLYIAIAALSMNVFLSGLQRIETQLAETLRISASSTPGAVTRSLWQSERFRRMVGAAVRDDRLVKDLFGTPPEVLVHGALSFFYTPLLVMLLTAHRIAEERAGGSARYVLFRASRWVWVLGKTGGQALLLLASLLAGAVAAWTIARFRMSDLQGWGTMAGMIQWSLRSWVFALGFLGLSLGISQLTRNPGLASALGVLSLMVLSILNTLAEHFSGPGVRQLWELGRVLSPYPWRTDLWRSSPAEFWPAVLMVVGLGLCYVLAGYAAWRRRDA